MDQLAQFKAKFRIEELLLLRTRCWTWSLRPAQCTLGSGILSLNRYCESLSQVSSDEAVDLLQIVVPLEAALRRTFKFDKINYLMLMMVDSHLHYHVIPRYSAARVFAGQEWNDDGWPSLPMLGAEIPPENLLTELKHDLQSALGS